MQHLYELEDGHRKVVVDAHLGAHIVEFSIGGCNALITQAPEIGSTFWPSPQSAWGWPPPHALDKAPFKADRQGQKLIFVSDACSVTGLRVRKEFQFKSGAMSANYTMTNCGEVPVQFAHWEITRLAGGITFYRSSVPPRQESAGHFSVAGGVVWHEYKPAELEHHSKLFGDESSGWLANANNGLLLIKRFAPVSRELSAPGEAEIEIYAHADPLNPYIEMEQQGEFLTIAPGADASWEVEWLIEQLPADIEPCPGSVALLQRVEAALR